MTTPDSTPKTVDVYVRLGEGGSSRTVSFTRPPEISQKAALEKGFAIDGRSLEMMVRACRIPRDSDFAEHGTPFCDHFEGVSYPLTDALRDTQLGIAKWLEGYGYEVTFR